MKRVKTTTLILAALALLVGNLPFGVTQQAHAGVLLNFSSPVPGTIADVNGNGTGFDTRLPGTGASLPSDDPNLNLTAGGLLITTTQTDFNYGGVNLGVAEAPGFYLQGVGNSDIIASTLVDNLANFAGSDQLCLYVGTSSSNVLRGGFTYGGGANVNGVYALTENNASTGNNDISPFVSSPNAFSPGDDVVLSIERINGLWSIAWNDLSNPSASGQSPSLDIASLDSQPNLYVGIYAANPSSPFITNDLVNFSVTTTPEPSTLTLFGLGVVGMAAYGRRRRKRPVT